MLGFMLEILKGLYTLLLVQRYMCYSIEIENFIQTLVQGVVVLGEGENGSMENNETWKNFVQKQNQS